MARRPFEGKNWYWFVGGDMSRVYSSAAGDYVPVSDATYVEWLAKDGVPTPIADETLLGGALAPHLARPTPPAILDAYKEAQAATLTPIDVVPQLLFMMENQIRALQGNPPLTFAQFRAFVKSLM